MSAPSEEGGYVILSGEEHGASEIQLPSGALVLARTDKGIGYSKPHNEDRIVVGWTPATNTNTGMDIVAVIDGMGGQGDGETAACIIARTLAENIATLVQENICVQMREIWQQAQACMRKEFGGKTDAYGNLLASKSGAALQIVALYQNTLGRFAHCFLAGDVRRIFIPIAGVVQQSTDEANGRYAITNALSGTTCCPTESICALGPGGRLILCSDGITDNLTTQEIVNMCRGSLQEILQEIWRKTGEKMTSRLPGNFPLSHSKPDNRAFLVVEIPELPTSDETPTAEQKLPDFEIRK